jgi:hypothetical protein
VTSAYPAGASAAAVFANERARLIRHVELGHRDELAATMPNHDLQAEAVHLLGAEEDSATM